MSVIDLKVLNYVKYVWIKLCRYDVVIYYGIYYSRVYV